MLDDALEKRVQEGAPRGETRGAGNPEDAQVAPTVHTGGPVRVTTRHSLGEESIPPQNLDRTSDSVVVSTHDHAHASVKDEQRRKAGSGRSTARKSSIGV